MKVLVALVFGFVLCGFGKHHKDHGGDYNREHRYRVWKKDQSEFRSFDRRQQAEEARYQRELQKNIPAPLPPLAKSAYESLIRACASNPSAALGAMSLAAMILIVEREYQNF